MAHYFVDNAADTDGNHVIHATGCANLPNDKRYLGNFYHLDEAVMEARKDFWHIRGCAYCSHGDIAKTDTVKTLRLPVPGRLNFS